LLFPFCPHPPAFRPLEGPPSDRFFIVPPPPPLSFPLLFCSFPTRPPLTPFFGCSLAFVKPVLFAIVSSIDISFFSPAVFLLVPSPLSFRRPLNWVVASPACLPKRFSRHVLCLGLAAFVWFLYRIRLTPLPCFPLYSPVSRAPFGLAYPCFLLREQNTFAVLVFLPYLSVLLTPFPRLSPLTRPVLNSLSLGAVRPLPFPLPPLHPPTPYREHPTAFPSTHSIPSPPPWFCPPRPFGKPFLPTSAFSPPRAFPQMSN